MPIQLTATQLHRLANLSAIWFDLDGTLVSSKLDFMSMRDEIGVPAGTDFIQLINHSAPKEAQRIREIIVKHEAEDARHAEALDGAKALLEYCRQQRWPIVIITRNTRENALKKLQAANLQFDTLITRDDAPAKPDPSIVLQLLDEYDLNPEQVMYLGDYLYDIETARNAGLMAGIVYDSESMEPEFAAHADISTAGLPELLSATKQAKQYE